MTCPRCIRGQLCREADERYCLQCGHRVYDSPPLPYTHNYESHDGMKFLQPKTREGRVTKGKVGWWWSR